MDKPSTEKTMRLIEEGEYDEAIDLLKQEHKSDISQKTWDWCCTWSTEELNLARKAEGFEELYFTDLKMDDYRKELTEFIDVETGNVGMDDLLEDGEAITITNNWMFKTDELENCVAGYCNYRERIICIDTEHLDDDVVLLHEMIHAYIDMLASNYQNFLSLKLYLKLQSQIPQLMEYITYDLHDRLFHRDSGHGPLFMLKSLDLDLRLKKPSGTIYGYGREEILRLFR